MLKIVAAGRCKKKNLMNEQKWSQLYPMGKSLNEKSGKQALRNKGGNRCWLIRICLFYQGDTSMYMLELQWGFGWAIFSLKAGKTSVNWNILIRIWNSAHLWDLQHTFFSFRGNWIQDGEQPATGTYRMWICSIDPECLFFKVKAECHQEMSKRQIFMPLPSLPLPLRPSFPWSHNEKTFLADTFTKFIRSDLPSEYLLCPRFRKR